MDPSNSAWQTHDLLRQLGPQLRSVRHPHRKRHPNGRHGLEQHVPIHGRSSRACAIICPQLCGAQSCKSCPAIEARRAICCCRYARALGGVSGNSRCTFATRHHNLADYSAVFLLDPGRLPGAERQRAQAPQRPWPQPLEPRYSRAKLLTSDLLAGALRVAPALQDTIDWLAQQRLTWALSGSGNTFFCFEEPRGELPLATAAYARNSAIKKATIRLRGKITESAIGPARYR